MKPILLPRLLVLLAVCGLRFGLAAQTYTLTDLGPGVANDINNSGHVVGTRSGVSPSYPTTGGFYFNGQNSEMLPPVARIKYSWNPFTGEDIYWDEEITAALAINDNDHIAGITYPIPNYQPFQIDVFIRNGTTISRNAEGGYAVNVVVNNNDVLAVSRYFYDQPFQYYNRSFIERVMVKAVHSFIFGINDHNIAVGSAAGGAAGFNGRFRACVMSTNGAVTFIDIRPAIVIVGGDVIVNANDDFLSHGYGINNAGHAVGVMRGAWGDHAFRYTGGALEDLGTLGGAASTARDINATDQVVGESQVAGGAAHAFLWQSGVMTDLNTFLPGNSGWVLTKANALNNRGDIVGVGTFGGADHAFLLSAPLVAPTPVVTATFAGGAVTLRWDAKTGAAQKVLRATVPEGPYTQVASGALAGTYTETPPAGAGHYYRIVWP